MRCIASALLLFVATSLHAQVARAPIGGIPANRRELIATELADAGMARVLVRGEVQYVGRPQLVGDSIVGFLGSRLGRATEGTTRVAVALYQVQRLESRNQRLSVWVGVVSGALLGYVHGRALQEKESLYGNGSGSAWNGKILTLSAIGAAIGAGVGFVVPAWHLIHERM